MAMPNYQSGYIPTPGHLSHEASHMHPGHVTAAPGVTASTVPQPITAHEAIEVAGRNVEKMIHSDSQFPSLAEKLRIGLYFFNKIAKFFCWKIEGIMILVENLKSASMPSNMPGNLFLLQIQNVMR